MHVNVYSVITILCSINVNEDAMAKIYGYSKICAYCKKPFEAKNKNAKYCCNGHRVTDFKIRHGIPLPDYTVKQIRNRIPSKLEKDVAEQTIILQGIDNDVHKYKEQMAKLNNEYAYIKDTITEINKHKSFTTKLRIIRRNKIMHKAIVS